MNLRIIIGGLAATGLLFGFVTWRLQSPRPPEVQAGVLFDRSDSVHEPCIALSGLANEIVQAAAGQDGVTISIFATGDTSTADGPELLLSRHLLVRQRLMKGKQRVAAERQALIAQLQMRCKQESITRRSPIFFGVQESVRHLRAADGVNTERQLFVISDLRETVEPRITRALAQPLGAKPMLPEPINNAGVRITFCGFAQTRDQHHISNERLIEVWSKLFNEPHGVKFQPFCPVSQE